MIELSPDQLVASLPSLSDSELDDFAAEMGGVLPEIGEPVEWERARRAARAQGAEGARRWFASLVVEAQRQALAITERNTGRIERATRRLHALLRRGPVGTCALSPFVLWLAAVLFESSVDAEAGAVVSRPTCRWAGSDPPAVRRPMSRCRAANAPPLLLRRCRARAR